MNDNINTGQPTMVIVDDFYTSPMAVRAEALGAKFCKSAEIPYPGLISEEPSKYRFEAIERIASLVQEIILADRDVDRQLGAFRILRKGEGASRFIHQHNRKWSALVYLNLPDQCSGGTIFYRHSKMGDGTSGDFIQDVAGGNAPHQSKPAGDWVELYTVPMRFNRLVIFDALQFHSGSPGFGVELPDSRLTQNFDFGPWVLPYR